MSVLDQFLLEQTANISRGIVVGTPGVILVRILDSEAALPCDVLQTSEKSLLLVEGDSVLVWRPRGQSDSALILGRIGPSRARSNEAETAPEELVLEAKRSLTLRVGDGTITIREDGKILIKGKDLVSHAQRMNRIKGGAVSIN